MDTPRTHPDAARQDEEREQQLVRDYLGPSPGFFVEVGANHPRTGSQSWHLEQRGWHGILVEPHPHFAAALRRARSAPIYQVACSSAANRGLVLPFYVAGPMSSLDRDAMAPGARAETEIQVSVRTLDDVLVDASAPTPLDFLSVDVEGHEVEVLRGFDFAGWQPRLILLEDHVDNLEKHHFMRSRGYRLVRRTGFNGWYVPADCPVRFGLSDRWELLRKYYLALPFRVLRNASRRLRQPIKDLIRDRRKRSSD